MKQGSNFAIIGFVPGSDAEASFFARVQKRFGALYSPDDIERLSKSVAAKASAAFPIRRAPVSDPAGAERTARALRKIAEMRESIVRYDVPKKIGAATDDRITVRIEGHIGVSPDGKHGVMCADVKALLDEKPRAKIVDIIVDSHGGSLDEAEKIFAALRSHRGHKTCYVTGVCASAAITVALAADWREANEEARILIHAPSIAPTSARWTRQTYDKNRAQLLACEEKMIQTFAARTGTSEAVFRAELAHERPMALADAKRHGLIHFIRPRP